MMENLQKASMEHMKQFDVIVVGAGLAGLSAAYELSLRRKRVLVLEAGEHPGGKILTFCREGVFYECGSLFAFDEESLPFPTNAGRLLPENHPIGVFCNGQVLAGESVSECLQALDVGARERLCLKQFLGSESPQAEMIGEDTSAALNAFFQVIHPGELSAYAPARRWDSLIRHNIAHFERGNAALIEALIDKSAADIRTGCRVSALFPDHEGVTVHWRKNACNKSARADWAVLAVPAPEAKALTREMDTASTAFLDKIRYGEGIAVILGLRDTALQPFSYIVSPQGPVNTFLFFHSTNRPDTIVLTAYLVAEKARHCWNGSDSQLAELVRAELNRLDIGVVEPEHVAFSDVYRWPAVGAIISNDAYSRFSKACLRPAERIVLAGDYAWWNEQQMPYGMQAALASGRRAAGMICDEPTVNVTTRFQAEPLAVSTRTVLTEKGPKFAGALEDGTIAYYGLILQAEPDIEMERYLVGEAENGLWAYQQDYGVTSLDSALVMEGLLSTGRHHQLLNYSADRLVEEFFDPDEGGFRTIPHSRQGRSAYWLGTDCLATACCAWLLQQLASERHAGIIKRCAHYLKRQQLISGHWPGKWFPSETIPVFCAVRVLAAAGSEFRECRRRASVWLCSRQKRDGSWMGSVIESAAALLALHVLDGPEDSIRRGREWLRTRRIDGGWPGEPILQYWFDRGRQRTFFHTVDKGQITGAWATIALRETDRPEGGI